MSLVSTVGIDLAKNVFSIHGVDACGVVMIRRTVSRKTRRAGGPATALPDRNGGVFGCPRMGATIRCLRPYRQTDGAKVCNPISQER